MDLMPCTERMGWQRQKCQHVLAAWARASAVLHLWSSLEPVRFKTPLATMPAGTAKQQPRFEAPICRPAALLFEGVLQASAVADGLGMS